MSATRTARGHTKRRERRVGGAAAASGSGAVPPDGAGMTGSGLNARAHDEGTPRGHAPDTDTSPAA
jgi:hypothetical protein